MNRTAQLVVGIILLVLLLGLLPGIGPWNLGYFPSGLVGLLLIVIILMAVLGGRNAP